MAFTVGMKVVCVDTNRSSIGWPRLIKKDAIYTVAAVGLIHPRDPDGLPCIRLVEISQLIYWAWRFRPVVSRKTEVSFTVGADPESEKWDNRKNAPWRVKEPKVPSEILALLAKYSSLEGRK